jgi:hypothetical protein
MFFPKTKNYFEVPDKVLRYIGGGAENLGESSNEQQARGMFIGGAAKAVDGTNRQKQLSNSKNNDSGNDGGEPSNQKSIGGAVASGASNAMSKFSKMLSPK